MSTEQKSGLKAAIFDVDGVLLDSMCIWEEAGERFLRGLGVQAAPGLSETLFPMSIREGAAYLKCEYGLSLEIPEIMAGIGKTVEEFYFQEAPLKPGAAEFLQALTDRGISIAAATSSEKEHIERAFQRLGIIRYFRRIVTCTEVGAGKTSPAVYLQAAGFLGSNPEETVVFEDALYALRTAKAAGFHTVGMYDRSSEGDQETLRQEAKLYLTGFAQAEMFWERFWL